MGSNPTADIPSDLGPLTLLSASSVTWGRGVLGGIVGQKEDIRGKTKEIGIEPGLQLMITDRYGFINWDRRTRQ